MSKKRMMACVIAWSLFLLWGFSIPANAQQKMHHRKAETKGTGILLVTFGTSIPEAQGAFADIEKRVHAAFPEIPVRWAYTSVIIRKKLAKTGQVLDSPTVALAKMMEEGFTRVAVQSLHIIPGAEFHDLRMTADAFTEMSDGFEQLRIGYPALSSTEDLSKAVDAVIGIIPEERKKDEAVVLMGHGTHHPANVYYEAMMYRLQQKDPNIYMGTVEGTPSLDDVRAMLLERGVKKAYLIPFMSVAGDHARNDMAGQEADSWKSILTDTGIECVPMMKGLAEYDAFAEIWVDHLRAVMDRMN